MRWKGREQSKNIEDRRGMRTGMAVGGGGLGLIILMVIATLLGADPRRLMQQAQNAQQQQQQVQRSGANGQIDDGGKGELIAVVLNDTEQVWTKLFQQHVQGAYKKPTLVMFTASTQTACGPASAGVGPFYCPADQKVYIDPEFFIELESRHNAAGDFAQAYVIAHEVAHHVQNLLGRMEPVDRARRTGDKILANQMSVRLELQADYLAGVWAHHAQREFGILEEGDIAEAINAANQIGDDTLQEQATGYVRPEHFTHGTSVQRAHWFKAGLATGDFEGLDQLFELSYEEL
ncbi:MAG: neutral zinc metallopeptidase [Pirellulaceae bacterium]|nr:neutral zinc metallopeptidase [Planctomycetales bacterium]